MHLSYTYEHRLIVVSWLIIVFLLFVCLSPYHRGCCCGAYEPGMQRLEAQTCADWSGVYNMAAAVVKRDFNNPSNGISGAVICFAYKSIKKKGFAKETH